MFQTKDVPILICQEGLKNQQMTVSLPCNSTNSFGLTFAGFCKKISDITTLSQILHFVNVKFCNTSEKIRSKVDAMLFQQLISASTSTNSKAVACNKIKTGSYTE